MRYLSRTAGGLDAATDLRANAHTANIVDQLAGTQAKANAACKKQWQRSHLVRGKNEMQASPSTEIQILQAMNRLTPSLRTTPKPKTSNIDLWHQHNGNIQGKCLRPREKVAGEDALADSEWTLLLLLSPLPHTPFLFYYWGRKENVRKMMKNQRKSTGKRGKVRESEGKPMKKEHQWKTKKK